MPLVRSDGLPTQHMRALAYWSAAPELDDFISLQVCGNEWVAHVTCRRQLIDELGVVNGNGNGSAKGGGPPTYDVFHGMVARDTHLDHLQQGRGAADRRPRRVGRAARSRPTPSGPRCGATTPRPTGSRRGSRSPTSSCSRPPSGSTSSRRSCCARARAASAGTWRGRRRTAAPAPLAAERAAEDPDYRFAVVQSELYRRHLRSSVEDLDVIPLARYVSHFARWYREASARPRSSGWRGRCSTRASAASDWRGRE